MANGDDRQAFNESLIDAIEREACLWDLRNKQYKNRSVCDAAWRRVAKAFTSGNLEALSSSQCETAQEEQRVTAQQLFSQMYEPENERDEVEIVDTAQVTLTEGHANLQENVQNKGANRSKCIFKWREN
ncbi:hypothetical protein HPB50_003178 [Hyalomma asiaticum]|uniref:Uncharacterized protein n=1 Tax=Hyalomma asiaticum TaxID=266040 RepID=A0ACB7RSB3_HYAAI|nr:hypothetical protein HPB50_003178 [Hyalomma asiaticum]